MTCTIIALLVVCSGAPIKTSPTVAVATLRPSPSLPVTRRSVDPIVYEAPRPREFQSSLPWLRLDGTLPTTPPWTHVAVGPPTVYVERIGRR